MMEKRDTVEDNDASESKQSRRETQWRRTMASEPK